MTYTAPGKHERAVHDPERAANGPDPDAAPTRQRFAAELRDAVSPRAVALVTSACCCSWASS